MTQRMTKPSWQTWASFAYEFRERAEKAESRVAELEAALRWYVENDDTYEGADTEWWMKGKRQAMKLLGMDE